jgi:maltoporin
MKPTLQCDASSSSDERAPRRGKRAFLSGCLGLAAAALSLSVAPREALAVLPDGAVDFSMYGRMGLSWGPNGQIFQGKTMNLTTSRQIGGRFEEGDYLEPTVTFNIIRPLKEKPDDTYVQAVFSPAMFARNGSFLGFFTNPAETLRIEIFQMFVEAGNVFTPGLTFWAGARFHRGADVHISDHFYFNDLSGQGVGVKYKGLDVALLVRSVLGNAQYSFQSDPSDAANPFDVNRVRSIVAAQYTLNFGTKTSFVQGLGELHVLPAARKGFGRELAPSDYGWAAGLKLHLDLGDGSFNDASVRYGARVANGSWGGTRTYETFGPAEPNGHYDGAYGLEVVEHFLFNIHPLFTINGYANLNVSRSALTAEEVTPEAAAAGVVDKVVTWAGGVRGFLYAHKKFHMIAEATVQGRKDGEKDMATAVKVSVAPTIVPTGETSAWGRPHLRAVYTAGFYNQAATEQLLSPYLQTFGPTRVGHYIGAKTEWWF